MVIVAVICTTAVTTFLLLSFYLCCCRNSTLLNQPDLYDYAELNQNEEDDIRHQKGAIMEELDGNNNLYKNELNSSHNESISRFVNQQQTDIKKLLLA
jgi:hypothetical protein